MNGSSSILKFSVVILLLLSAVKSSAQAQFVPNQGQWPGDFTFRAELSNGALFFENRGFSVVLHEAPHEDGHHHGHNHTTQSVAYRMRFAGANYEQSRFEPAEKQNFYHNYFLGKNPSNWHPEVPVYQELQHNEVYPGVDIHYKSLDGHLKYDIHISEKADPSSIKMQYSGLKKLELKNGSLLLHTGLGVVSEYIPEAYQIINGQKHIVEATYTLDGETVGFEVKKHKPGYPVVIDPLLKFSTFTGSTANNWGYTATYDNDGSFYGGGITLSTGYPVTTGVIQNQFMGGDCDVAISKFNATGTQLLFSTYLGGSQVEVPQSMVVDKQGNLIVLGSTGSSNFPTTANSFQSSFSPGQRIEGQSFTYKNGAHIYITKINTNGTSILASTFLGGNIGDGVNTKIFKNYGDNARGEVIALSNNNIAITTSVQSTDLPLGHISVSPQDSTQNAVVAVFSPNLQNLVWGNYFGGTGNETGYSIRTDNAHLYLAGATTSSNLPASQNAVQQTLGGNIDGYIAKFDLSNGNLAACTYVGTPQDDQTFMIDVDRRGDIYTYGQSEGNMPVTPGKYNNAGSNQFVQKYSSDLATRKWSTQVGSGQSKNDLVPTAFMVDYCLNIYLSGWNGGSNSIGSPPTQRGNTRGLPVSADAFQKTTDGSDFYFMILDHDASGLVFGSYFGGTSEEHVDGGTSRFSPDGIIYQAACAACYQGDFPTTPTAFSPSKPTRDCNLGAIKIDFESTVRAEPAIDFNADVDTTCSTLEVQFTNNSFRANKYYWDFGNGQTSSQEEPLALYTSFGSYTVTLVAEDTLCGLRDTATITFDHDQGFRPEASFEINYAGCDQTYEARFTNTSEGNNHFYWDFGDGRTASSENPVHNFKSAGTHQVMLVITDKQCQTSDTAFHSLTFEDTVAAPEVQVWHPKCGNGTLSIDGLNLRERYKYNWSTESAVATGLNAALNLNKAGVHRVSLRITDPLCSAVYDYEFTVNIHEVSRDVYIPNAFTPNKDGINDEFIITGDECGVSDVLRIFNRWGQIIFETNRPYHEFWDGTYHGREVPAGVYIYLLKTPEDTHSGHLTLFR